MHTKCKTGCIKKSKNSCIKRSKTGRILETWPGIANTETFGRSHHSLVSVLPQLNRRRFRSYYLMSNTKRRRVPHAQWVGEGDPVPCLRQDRGISGGSLHSSATPGSRAASSGRPRPVQRQPDTKLHISNSTSLTGKHHFKAKQRAPTYPRANCVASERLSRDLCAEETGVWLIETRWEAEKVVIKALSEDNYRYRLT